jgi:hypothetical protein
LPFAFFRAAWNCFRRTGKSFAEEEKAWLNEKPTKRPDQIDTGKNYLNILRQFVCGSWRIRRCRLSKFDRGALKETFKAV